LFDEDLDEEDDDEEEEEEETAAPPATTTAQSGGGVQESNNTLASTSTGGMDLTQLPRRTDRAIKPLPSSINRQTSISPSASPIPTYQSTASLPSPPPPLSSFAPSTSHPTQSDESTKASFALAASIQKHLAFANENKGFDFELPKMPRPVATRRESLGAGVTGKQRIGTAV